MKDNVIWFLEQVPSWHEERSMEKMNWNMVVLDLDLAYILMDEYQHHDMDLMRVVNKLTKFAKDNNAKAIVGNWQGAMYEYLRSTNKPDGIKCYYSKTTGQGRRKYNTMVFVGNL